MTFDQVRMLKFFIFFLTVALPLECNRALGQGSAPKELGLGHEFDNDPLNAGGFGPMNGTLRVASGARTTLVRPRTSFVPEMLKSVENLLRFDLPGSSSLLASPPALHDAEGFFESETYIYVDRNGDGRWPYDVNDTAFNPSDPDLYIWNITGLDWSRDAQGNVILDGDFNTNFAIAPPTITLKLPASQWQADFLSDTLPPESHLGLLPFELTMDFGANGGVSVLSAEGVIWAPAEVAAAAPEPSTFVLAAMGLTALSLIGWRRRKRKVG